MKRRLVVLKLHPAELENYRAAVELPTTRAALRVLAQAVLAGLGGHENTQLRVRFRLSPMPVLGLFGEFSEGQLRVLRVQGEALRQGCRTLRYVGLERARQDCSRLARRLVEQVGRETLAKCKFVAVPRGGLVVLGMLSYALGLRPEQLELGERGCEPLVVVDDCCLSGKRCAEALERYSGRSLIFAHLYSHPQLRVEVEKEEFVLACVAAHDLHDFGPALFGDRYARWRGNWRDRLEGCRYWIGMPEALGFFWSEPARSVFVSAESPMEPAWKILPPSLCLANPRIEWAEERLSEQPKGVGPIRPSERVLFLEQNDTLILGDLESGECLELGGSAPRIWAHLVDLGTVEAAARALAEECDVALDRARGDTRGLWLGLAEQDLLTRAQG